MTEKSLQGFLGDLLLGHLKGQSAKYPPGSRNIPPYRNTQFLYSNTVNRMIDTLSALLSHHTLLQG